MALSVLTTRRGIIQKRDTFEGSNGFCDELLFNRMFRLERKRAQRSRKPFILILIHITGLTKSCPHGGVDLLRKALSSAFRETDFRGWYRRGSVIGIVFTELHSVGENTRAVLFGKLMDALASRIEPDLLQKIYITFHTYPASCERAISCGRFDMDRYPVPAHRIAGASFSPAMRRLTKAVTGLAALIKVVPIFFLFPPSKP